MSYDPHEMVGRMRVLLEEALTAMPKGQSYRGLKQRIRQAVEDSRKRPDALPPSDKAQDS